MMAENLGKALSDEKYSKKKVVKCKESHCAETVEPNKEKTV